MARYSPEREDVHAAASGRRSGDLSTPIEPNCLTGLPSGETTMQVGAICHRCNPGVGTLLSFYSARVAVEMCHFPLPHAAPHTNQLGGNQASFTPNSWRRGCGYVVPGFSTYWRGSYCQPGDVTPLEARYSEAQKRWVTPVDGSFGRIPRLWIALPAPVHASR